MCLLDNLLGHLKHVICALDADVAVTKGLTNLIQQFLGGAHREPKQRAAFLKRALNDALRQVSDLSIRDLMQRRYERLQSYGRFSDTTAR